MAVTLSRNHTAFSEWFKINGGILFVPRPSRVFFFGLEVCVEGELVVFAARHDAGLLVVSDPGKRKLKRGKLDLNRPRS